MLDDGRADQDRISFTKLKRDTSSVPRIKARRCFKVETVCDFNEEKGLLSASGYHHSPLPLWKIHPVSDPEALPPAHPTAPLVPRGSSRSEHGDPTKESVTQPPLLDTPRRKKRGSCCCRCVCYTLLVIFLLIVIVGAAVGILYLVFRPKLPDYNIDRLLLTRFTFNQDSSLSTAFNVTITAKNPNEKIGIYYEDGSRISVLYMQTRLSNGSLPKFYQGHENTTIIFVEMTGYTRNATSLMATLQEQQRLTESIPLRIRVTQPVRIKLGKLKLMEVKFMVRCSVSVDSLAANNVIRVRSSNCKFRFRL
ncbi:BnaC06g12110D [Brassica napus]|uniref:BnaC06g12110D protein n=2 Tax=Brassica TaxID=3705 RepID=A0A078GKA8_BRANA|nr:BnaC06g12110D [Brassica napus]VDD61517.1 unnamed protein product [Brassica oleracea]